MQMRVAARSVKRREQQVCAWPLPEALHFLTKGLQVPRAARMTWQTLRIEPPAWTLVSGVGLVVLPKHLNPMDTADPGIWVVLLPTKRHLVSSQPSTVIKPGILTQAFPSLLPEIHSIPLFLLQLLVYLVVLVMSEVACLGGSHAAKELSLKVLLLSVSVMDAENLAHELYRAVPLERSLRVWGLVGFCERAGLAEFTSPLALTSTFNGLRAPAKELLLSHLSKAMLHHLARIRVAKILSLFYLPFELEDRP